MPLSPAKRRNSIARLGERVELVRFAAPAACVLGPFFFYFFIFLPIVRDLIAIDFAPQKTPSKLLAADVTSCASHQRELGIYASDVAGRYTFAIQTALFVCVSILGLVYALIVIGRRFNLVRSAIVIGIVIVAINFVSSWTIPGTVESTRQIVVQPVMTTAIEAKLVSPTLHDRVSSQTQRNVRFGVTTTLILLIAFAVLAIPARDDELTSSALRERRSELRWLVIIAAAFFVLSVFISRSLVEWHLGFLCQEARSALKTVVAPLTTYWGTVTSAVLLLGVLPAFLVWTRDVRRFSRVTLPEAAERDRQKLAENENLEFATASAITAILTIATPALSGWALDTIKSLLERIG
jgi:hypothetical protein